MTRDDDQTSAPLAAGAARRQVQQLAALYRGPTTTVECPDCGGTGRRENGRWHYVCVPCGGTGRVDG